MDLNLRVIVKKMGGHLNRWQILEYVKNLSIKGQPLLESYIK